MFFNFLVAVMPDESFIYLFRSFPINEEKNATNAIDFQIVLIMFGR